MKLLEIYLLEAKCPSCGAEGAYIGLHDVECKNSECEHFKQQQSSLLNSTKKILDKKLTYAQLKAYLEDDSEGSEFDNTTEFILDGLHDIGNEFFNADDKLIKDGDFYVTPNHPAEGGIIITAEFTDRDGIDRGAAYEEDDDGSGNWIPL